MKIAVIPARGGSKRIPRKNVKPFAGLPMIAHAIRTALKSAMFEHVVVSTDDAEIAEVAREHGAELPFRRPAHLADDHTPTVPVIAHAIQALAAHGWTVDTVCCIYPTVPLLRCEDLIEGFATLERAGGAGYSFPVVSFASPVQRALRRLSDDRVEPLFAQHVNTRTQDLEPAYHDAGQFYWARASTWLEGVSVHDHGRCNVVPDWTAVDIDTEADWRRAEALYEVQHRRLAL